MALEGKMFDSILVTWYAINVCIFTGEIFMDIAVMLFIIEASGYYYMGQESVDFILLGTNNYSQPVITQSESNRSRDLGHLTQVCCIQSYFIIQ